MKLDLNQVRGIIFDCDGTLADTMPAHYEAWRAALAACGLALSEDRFYSLGGRPTLWIAELLISESGRTIDAQQLSHDKELHFCRVLHMIQPIAPVVEVVRRYRRKVPLAVATSATREVCIQTLHQIAIPNWFDAIVSSEDVERHKPHPDVFLEAARRLNVEPRFCLVYEDTDSGVEAARRACMDYVDVRDFHTPRRVSH